MKQGKIFTTLIVLFVLALFMGTSVQAQTTWFVDAQYGLDTYDGQVAIPNQAGVGTGPKLTLQNAINAAAAGDIISVAPRGITNPYNLNTTISITKNLSFRVTPNATVGFSGTPNSGNVAIAGDISIGAFTLTLLNDPAQPTFLFELRPGWDIAFTGATGSLTNAQFLQFSGTAALENIVTRNTDATVFVGTPVFGTGAIVDLVYNNALAFTANGVGTEWSSPVRNVTASGSGAVRLGASRTMTGILTLGSGNLSLEGNTLTVNNAGATAHALGTASITSASPTSGALTLTGAGNQTWAGGGAIPTLNDQSSGTAVNSFAAVATVNGSVNLTVGTGNLTLTAVNLVTAGVSNTTASNIVFSLAGPVTVGSSGTFTVSNTGGGQITFANNLLDGAGITSLLQTGIGQITVTGTTVIDGSVTNGGSVTAASSGLITLTGAATIGGSVLNNPSVGNFSNSGIITFSGAATVAGTVTNSATVAFTAGLTNSGNIVVGGAATITGAVLNSASVTLTSATAQTATASGNITFADAVHSVGSLSLGATVTSHLTATTGTIAVAVSNAGNINFNNTVTPNHVTVTGTTTILSSAVGNRTAATGGTNNGTLNNTLNINFLSTTGTVAFNGAVTVSTSGYGTSATNPFVTAGAANFAGSLNMLARTTGTVTIGTAPSAVNLLVNNSTALEATNNGVGHINFNTAGTGLVTVNGNVLETGAGTGDIFFGAGTSISGTAGNGNVTASGTATGTAITFGDGTVSISGTVANSSPGNIVFNNTTTSVGVSGAITNSGAGNINFTLTTGSLSVTGAITNSSTGNINVPLTTGSLTATGGVTNSGTGIISVTSLSTGTLTSGPITVSGGSVNLGNALASGVFAVTGNVTASGGTLNLHTTAAVNLTGNLSISGSATVSFEAGNPTSAITLTGNYNHPAGTVNFGTGVRNFNVGGASNVFTALSTVLPANVVGTFNNNTTLNFNGTVAQVLSVSGGGTSVWPGHVTVNNTFGGTTGINAFTLQDGNLKVNRNVTFTDGQVVIRGVYLFIDEDFAYNNAHIPAEAYATPAVSGTDGFISMQNSLFVPGANVISAANSGITYGNFEVDNSLGASFNSGAARNHVFTAIFGLTNGVVSVAGAGPDVIEFNKTPKPFPQIRRNQGSFGVAPTFTNPVDVMYLNSATLNMGNEIPTANNRLHNLSVRSVGGAAGVTALANFSVNGTLNVKSAYVLNLSGFTLEMSGNIANNDTSQIQLEGNADITGGGLVNLSRAAGTSIVGTGTTGSDLLANTITANVSVLAGSIGNQLVGLRQVIGNLSVTGNGTVSLSFVNESPVVAGYDNFTGTFNTTGAGAGVTLLSRVRVAGNYVHNGGIITLNTFNLEIEGVANSQDGVAKFTTGQTGFLRFVNATAGPTSFTVTTSHDTIPNLEVATTSGQAFNVLGVADLVVSSTFLHTSGSIGLTTNLRVSGNTYTVNDKDLATIGGAATLFLAPTTGTLTVTVNDAVAPTLSASYVVNNLNINGNVTLNAVASVTGLDVNNATFTHANGLLTFGTTNLLMTGTTNFTRTAATTYSGTGFLVWNSTGTFAQSNFPMQITNFRISSDLNLATSPNNGLVTVANTLHLDGNVVVTNPISPATIELQAGVASGVVPMINITGSPQVTRDLLFGTANADYTFTGAGSTVTNTVGLGAGYWPAAPTTLARNVVVNLAASGNIVNINNSRQINGNLTLTQGVLNVATAMTLTLFDAPVPTLTRTVNGSITLTGSGAFAANNVMLVYSGNGTGTSGVEYLAPVTISALTVGANTNPLGWTFGATRTVTGVSTFNGPTTVGAITTYSGALNINAATTFGANVTANAAVTIATNQTLALGVTVFTLSNNLTMGSGAAVTGGNLVFNGGFPQIFQLGGSVTVASLTVNQAPTSLVRVTSTVPTGSILTLSTIGSTALTLTRGVLQIDTPNVLRVGWPTSNVAQMFTRGGSFTSHVNGIFRIDPVVAGSGTATRIEFPIGDTLNFRPVATTFSAFPGIFIEMSHINETPGGNNGLPINTLASVPANAPLTISQYPNFYWLVRSGSSLGAVNFNLEMTASGYTLPSFVNIANARLIRKSVGGDIINNPWFLQGVNYDNYLAPPSNTPTVTSVTATGGINPTGSRFTFGLNSTLYVKNPLANRNLALGTAALTQNLVNLPDSLFGGATSALTFSASSANPSIAVASVTGNILSISPVALGTTQITVVGQNTANGIINNTFNVTVNAAFVVVSPIADQTLVGAAPATSIALGTVFSGGTAPYSYTASTSNSAVVAVSITGGNTLTLTPANVTSTQVATVIVTANDASTPSAQTRDTIAVTVNPAGFVVTGTVTYNNSASTPLSGVTVTLTPGSFTAVTNASGVYNFAAVPNGTYTLAVSTTRPWGGVSGSDVTAVRLHIIGTTPLAGLRLLAADVNNDATVTGSDVTSMRQRIIGASSSFPAGDWRFNNAASVTVSGASVTSNFQAIIVGDVNGDFVPTVAKEQPNMSVNSTEILKVNPKLEFEVPVKISSDLQVSSYTFYLNYPKELVQFTGIKGFEGLVYNEKDGKVSLVWDDIKLNDLKANQVIFALQFKPTVNFKAGVSFTIDVDAVNSELASFDKILTNAGVTVSTVEGFVPAEFSLRQNYPNPFNPSTQIQYDIPVDGKVTLDIYNVLGQKVASLINELQTAGAYKVEWNASNLPSGMYIYSITVEGTGKNFKQTKKMMLTK
ncbi:MAG: hypothetical protein C0425_09010 [Chlorobiaceae bacterium]|nr:hypothetical protein [Chlorobiaceae bacterium]MBA4310462.1 hypothetical protein [Chlorobiaceae bacterium]